MSLRERNTMMRLGEFIEGHTARIMDDWVEFARATGPEADRLSVDELRDHIARLLAEIVADMPRAAEDRDAQTHQAGVPARVRTDAASEHARQRAAQGFGLREITSEFRALRASVLRLWQGAGEESVATVIDDTSAFNDAIDSALTGSLEVFLSEIDQSRHLFMGIVGHDLRSPLNTVMGAADLILRSDSGTARPAQMILRGAAQMAVILDDLTEFTADHLGSPMVIRRVAGAMEPVVEQVVSDLREVYPQSILKVVTHGGTEGYWDIMRICRLITNLLTNALKYGAKDRAITVTIDGASPDSIRMLFHNEGTPIAADILPHIFEPLTTTAQRDELTHATGLNLGLGLYVAKGIAQAHGGDITATSSAESGTRFTVVLSRGEAAGT